MTSYVQLQQIPELQMITPVLTRKLRHLFQTHKQRATSRASVLRVHHMRMHEPLGGTTSANSR